MKKQQIVSPKELKNYTIGVIGKPNPEKIKSDNQN